MLLTQTTWEEKNPVRRQLFSPYTAFRCVAVSSESPCFLVQHTRDESEEDSLPVGTYLMTKAEDVLEVVGQLEGGCSRVYAFPTQPMEAERCVMSAIADIRSYCEDGVTWFSYATTDGTIIPCLPWQPRASSDHQLKVEWSSKR